MKPNNHNYIEEVKLDFPHKDDNNWLEIEVGGQKIPQYPSPLEVKMLLTAYHEHLIGEVEEMRKTEYKYVHEFPNSIGILGLDGEYNETVKKGEKIEMTHKLEDEELIYNQALDDIITKLQAKK